MEQFYFIFGIVAAELGLVAVVTWFVMQLRGETKERDAQSRLEILEREEEELKKAA